MGNIKNKKATCLSHYCEDCETELRQNTMVDRYIVPIVFVIFAGILMLSQWWMDSSLYDPRCYVKEDTQGYTNFRGERVEAIKQFPVRCSEFELGSGE